MKSRFSLWCLVVLAFIAIGYFSGIFSALIGEQAIVVSRPTREGLQADAHHQIIYAADGEIFGIGLMEVTSGGFHDSIGLRDQDIILRFGDQPIADREDPRWLIEAVVEQDAFRMLVMSADGKEREVSWTYSD